MNRRILLFAVGFLALILATAFYTLPKKTIEVVNIGVLPHIIPSLPHWVAVEEGFYKEENIKIKEYTQRSSSVLIQSMTNGDLDYIPAVATHDAINGLANNKTPLKAKIISHSKITKDEPFTGLLVAKNSKISTLKDLEGKKIAVFPGNAAKSALKVFLKSKDINISKISMIPVVPPEHLGVLQSGDVDVSFAYEPMRTLYKDKTVEIYSGVYASLNNPSAIGVTLISNKLINKRPKVAKKLISIWNKSIDFIEKNKIRAREILQNKLKLDKVTAQNASWVNATKTTEMDYKILNDTIKSYQKMNLINSNFILDKQQLLDND